MTRDAVLSTLGMHALSCLLLFLSPSASRHHPKDAGTWHEPHQRETLAAASIAVAVTRLGQGHGTGKQRVVPWGRELPRWDWPSQLLVLLKMISSPLANELAAGRAVPASARSAVLPLPPRRRSNGGSFSLCSVLSTAPVGTRTGRLTGHGRPKGAIPTNNTNPPERGTPKAKSFSSGLWP